MSAPAIRPELRGFLRFYFETIIAVLVALGGAFVAAQGGFLAIPFGVALSVSALIWARSALRRLKFARLDEAPGLVEVLEGRIGFFGAGQGLGGYISLDELTEIRLLTLNNRAHWRLKSADQALLIPVGAHGAEALFDAFCTLPQIDMALVAQALSQAARAPDGPVARIPAQSVWRRAP